MYIFSTTIISSTLYVKRKKKGKIHGRIYSRKLYRQNIQEKAVGSQSHDATSHCKFIYVIYLEQLLRNLITKLLY